MKPIFRFFRLFSASARRSLIIVLVLLSAHNCRPPQRIPRGPDGRPLERPDKPAAAEESAARLQAKNADAMANRGDKAGAERLRDSILKRFPATQAAAEISIARAQRAADDGRAQEAVDAYERILYVWPTHPASDRIREALATELLVLKKQTDALPILEDLYRRSKNTTDKLRIGLVLAQLQQDLGHNEQAVALLVDLIASPALPASQQNKAMALVTSIVSDRLSFTEAENLWKDRQSSPTWSFVQPLLAYKLAKIYYHTRDYGRSEKMLTLIEAQYPQSPYAEQARNFLEFLRNRFAVNTQTIGVILPLSGKFKQYGERSLQAIQLALGLRTKLQVVVRDTQGDPALAAQAVESLVLENHAIAIIGPLFSAEAVSAAMKAEELSVPLLSLSFREGIPQLGSYVFRTALTVSAQAKALAKEAFDNLGMQRFAILYPRSRYGIDFTKAFWAEVQARHGEIRGAESYDPEQTTFREPVRRLVGRWYLNARPEFKEAFDKLKEQHLSPMRRRTEIDRLSKSIRPIVDFDGIVIPDSGRQIGLITPALVFEDIVLTHNPKSLDKMRKATGIAELRPITLLGASTWNSAQTLDSCEQYCEDAVFVDAFFADSTHALARNFVEAFHQATGADPFLGEAQAFDTAGLLQNVLQTHRPQTRQNLRDDLLAFPAYTGITGSMHFDSDGELQKELSVLTIKDHTIQLLPPPEQPNRF